VHLFKKTQHYCIKQCDMF